MGTTKQKKSILENKLIFFALFFPLLPKMFKDH